MSDHEEVEPLDGVHDDEADALDEVVVEKPGSDLPFVDPGVEDEDLDEDDYNPKLELGVLDEDDSDDVLFIEDEDEDDED